jgi:hypothetical protein
MATFFFTEAGKSQFIHPPPSGNRRDTEGHSKTQNGPRSGVNGKLWSRAVGLILGMGKVEFCELLDVLLLSSDCNQQIQNDKLQDRRWSSFAASHICNLPDSHFSMNLTWIATCRLSAVNHFSRDRPAEIDGSFRRATHRQA